MLMRTDPFRELDRLTQQVFGTNGTLARPAVMPMHAWRDGDTELIAAERPRGVFSRQLILGDNLDTEQIAASYDGGVLTLRIPVAEQAKPRKISITSESNDQQAINA